MKTNPRNLILAGAIATLAAACATVPPGPPPDVVRLQNDLDRLHGDPRIAANGGAELANADAAVDMLARNARTLDARAYQQGVYISDKLVGIAEASALARYAEQRGTELGVERERLVARTTIVEPRRTTTVVTEVPTGVVPTRVVRSDTGELVPRARSELMAMQDRMPGVESRLDSRGLVVRLGDYMFEPNRAELTPTAERSLDSVARACCAPTWTPASRSRRTAKTAWRRDAPTRCAIISMRAASKPRASACAASTPTHRAAWSPTTSGA